MAKDRKVSPGIGGAISDAIGAVADYAGPKSITKRPQIVDSAVSDADPSGDVHGPNTGAQGQSTDAINGYSS